MTAPGTAQREREHDLSTSFAATLLLSGRQWSPIIPVSNPSPRSVHFPWTLLPGLQELHLQDDYCHLKLRPLRARPHTATPSLPIPPGSKPPSTGSAQDEGDQEQRGPKARQLTGVTALAILTNLYPRSRSPI
ncbi:hypothetical protein JB92DRAFT_3119687 [Gautieria morchelliformis]|nr:hypothetical protein JB92DRAFT_3119687 [Gautieria morchelliformis]